MVIDNKTNCVQQTINVSFTIKSYGQSHADDHGPGLRTFSSLEKSVEIRFSQKPLVFLKRY